MFLAGTAHAAHRRRGRGRHPAPGRLPLRGDRVAPRARLRAARRGDRPALQPARRGSKSFNINGGRAIIVRDLSARSRSSEHEHRHARRRRSRLRGIAAISRAWLVAARPPRRFQASRAAAAVAAASRLGALARHRCSSASRWCSSTRRARHVRPRAAALAGRDLQRDHRLRQVGLVPRSARRPDRAGGRAARRSPGARQPGAREPRGAAAAFCSSRSRVPGLVVTIVKRLIGRARPLATCRTVRLYAVVLAARIREPAVRALDHGVRGRGRHRRAVAAGAHPDCWSTPCSSRSSRVVVTAHFVSDVVAGAFVGAFGAILVRNWFAARGLAFVAEARRRRACPPGPSWRRIKAVARGADRPIRTPPQRNRGCRCPKPCTSRASSGRFGRRARAQRGRQCRVRSPTRSRPRWRALELRADLCQRRLDRRHRSRR